MNYDTFNWELYIDEYDDLKFIKSKDIAWSHWVRFGIKEKRKRFFVKKKEPVSKFISHSFFEKNYTIYITRHMNSIESSKYWLHNYQCIRKIYKDIKIIIIDDNSNDAYKMEDKKHADVQFIQSEFVGRGELLPYYYFHKEPLTKYALFIHDSVFIKSAIHDGISEEEFISLWGFNSFSWHGMLMNNFGTVIDNLNMKEELFNLYKSPSNWVGNFGCMCVISIDYIRLIDDTFNIFPNLLSTVKTRNNRMCLERLLSIMYKKIRNKNPRVLFDDIHAWSILSFKRPWGLTWNEYVANDSDIKTSIVKVWSGR